MPAVSGGPQDARGARHARVDRLSRLLSEFLDFARVRVARTRTDRPRRRASRGAARLALAHPDRPTGVRDHVASRRRATFTLEGDEDLLHRAVFNLVLNAVQASPPDGEVQVARRSARGARRARSAAGTTFPDGARSRSASPTGGAGIPAEIRDRLFDPFFTTKPGGSGPRPRRGASRHRGASRTRVRRQQHARAHASPIVLPCVGRALQPARSRMSVVPTHRCCHVILADRIASKPVLVVDDETGILESLGILLRNEGFAPHTAHGGRAGLERSSEHAAGHRAHRRPHAGRRRAWRFSPPRARAIPDMPVILMTAQATLQSAMQAVNEGAFYYIQKPFRNDELLAILQRAAEHRKLRVENTSLQAGDQAARAHRGWRVRSARSKLARRAAPRGDRRADRFDGAHSGRVGHR